VDKAKDEAINKLITGQEKMGKDICALQIGQEKMGKDICVLQIGQDKMGKDICVLQIGQEKMGKDICSLQIGQDKMGKDICVIQFGQEKMGKDITELKQGQEHLETMMLTMLEEMTSLKRVVINSENDLRPKVKTLFDADKVRHYDTTELKQICREQETRLDDHELRITRLEK